MKRLLALGVTQLSDSYPNIRFKLAALASLQDLEYSEYIVPLGGSNDTQSMFGSMRSSLLIVLWYLIIGHLKTLLHCLREKSECIYICYPGVLIAVFLGLPYFRDRHEVIYLDAFISLYDTVVNDKSLLVSSSLLARALYWLERKAFVSANLVIVDTPENAQYLSELYDIEHDKFFAIPLSTPPLQVENIVHHNVSKGPLRCLFLGTFVPLQGISVIVEASRLMVDDADIEFVFIGEGQDAEKLHDYLEGSQPTNIKWYRGHFPTDFLVRQIMEADICLGIFGGGSKAQRVLPYKIYYYLALGKPIITASSQTTDRIAADCDNRGELTPMLMVRANDAGALAATIAQLSHNRSQLSILGSAAREYYNRALSKRIIKQRLVEMLAKEFSDKLSVN